MYCNIYLMFLKIVQMKAKFDENDKVELKETRSTA
jgi:hypothetical protein